MRRTCHGPVCKGLASYPAYYFPSGGALCLECTLAARTRPERAPETDVAAGLRPVIMVKPRSNPRPQARRVGRGCVAR